MVGDSGRFTRSKIKDARQSRRLECGGFSTALVRTPVLLRPRPFRAHESGGKRATLQTLREVWKRMFASVHAAEAGECLSGEWDLAGEHRIYFDTLREISERVVRRCRRGLED